MPMYEYQCAACGHRLEAIQKFADKPLKNCPKCKKSKLERLLSSPAIQFKGTGWYITDYARKSSPESAKSNSEDSSKEKKSDTASDTGKDSGASAKDSSKEAPKPAPKAESTKAPSTKK